MMGGYPSRPALPVGPWPGDGARERSAPRSGGRPWLAAGDRARMLAWLSTPGCPVCHQQSDAVEKALFWFLNEQYDEPEMQSALSRSLGFCPAHTQWLLTRASPSTLAVVYAYLIRSAVDHLGQLRLRARRRGLGGNDLALVEPRGPCPFCEVARRQERQFAWTLQRTLRDPQVEGALERHPGVCLTHLAAMAPALDDETLSVLAASLYGALAADPDEGAPPGRLHLLVARPSPPPACGHGRGGALEVLPDGPGSSATGRMHPAGGLGRANRWPSALDRLREELKGDRCLVCAQEWQTLRTYLPWLAGEIRTAPETDWHDALWLCPSHFWALACHLDDACLQRLAGALRRQWEEPLRWLSGGQVRRGRRMLAQGMRECPACRHLANVQHRTADLLARALDDPVTAGAYQEGAGVCLRHLRSLLAFCRSGETVGLVLRSMEVRLRVLEWELAELLRKQDWNVRFEPEGPEATAAYRAARFYSGLFPDRGPTPPTRAA